MNIIQSILFLKKKKKKKKSQLSWLRWWRLVPVGLSLLDQQRGEENRASKEGGGEGEFETRMSPVTQYQSYWNTAARVAHEKIQKRKSFEMEKENK